MKIEVDQLPEELIRALFEALRLEIRYNRDTHTATCRVTLTGPTIAAACRIAHDAVVVSLDEARHRREQRKQDQREPESSTVGDDAVPILCGAPGAARAGCTRVPNPFGQHRQVVWTVPI